MSVLESFLYKTEGAYLEDGQTTSDVDDAIEYAIDKDEPGLEDVNLAKDFVTDKSYGSNPGALTYGPDSYTQHENMKVSETNMADSLTGDSKPAATSNDDSNVEMDECSGKGTGSNNDSVEESEFLTPDELFNLYQESCVEVMRESKAAIGAKYKKKVKAAKAFKAKKMADKTASKKRSKLEAAAYTPGGINSVLEQILDSK